MNTLPVRFFHAFVSSVVICLLPLLGIYQVESRLHATPSDTASSSASSPAPLTSSTLTAPIAPSTPADPNDRDRDGIPNDWEIANHHSPDDASDAARDFDLDGLTALQEYQLSVASQGTYGNPIGKWKASSWTIPNELTDGGFSWVWPSCANGNGDVVVQMDGEFVDSDGNWQWKSKCAVIQPDGRWRQIDIPGKSDGHTFASDMNENGQVLLQWHSENWKYCESYTYSLDGSFSIIQIHGDPCQAWRFNNHGDWIGWAFNSLTGSWDPAQVINGQNVADKNRLTNWQLQDINDYGEVMGTYADPFSQRDLTFLQQDLFFFSTGQVGEFAFLKGAPHSWTWPAAMNNWGEFTGGSYRFTNDWSGWQARAFLFDGDYKEIKPDSATAMYDWPVDVSDDAQVLHGGYSSTWQYGASLWSDHINVPISQLWKDSNNYSWIYPSKLTPSGGVLLSTFHPGTDSIGVTLLKPDDDADGDGMPDDWEVNYGLNPQLVDSNADPDQDGTNNLGEFLLHSDPHAAPIVNPNGDAIDLRPGIDTDGDSIPNSWELKNHLDYLDPSDAVKDFDRDGYTNLQEFRLNTDPRGAPAYRVREISASSLVNPVLGESISPDSGAKTSEDLLTDWIFCRENIQYNQNISYFQGSAWSIDRASNRLTFSSYSNSSKLRSPRMLASAPSGGVFAVNTISKVGTSATTFSYWPSPSSTPVTLSGAPAAANIRSLTSTALSPSGSYLVGNRINANNASEWIVWKMPVAGTIFKPIVLTIPAGVMVNPTATLFVNDAGCVASTCVANGKTYPILWSINAEGSAATSAIFPLPANTYGASLVGMTNSPSPTIAGNSQGRGLPRGTLWASGKATEIGTPTQPATITLVSPSGVLAGIICKGANESTRQPFIASRHNDSSRGVTSWQVEAQDVPNGNFELKALSDSGDLVGSYIDANSKRRQLLWSHGRSYPLDASFPESSGLEVKSIEGVNAHGTLLATAMRNTGVTTTVLLTPDRDTDGDGMPDRFENQYQLNPYVKQSATSDSDNDGLSDFEEFRNQTHPRNRDTDGDGMNDGWEVSFGLLPLDPADAALDPDGDHVTNLRESQIKTQATGIYQMEILSVGGTDQVHSATDDGSVILTHHETNNSEDGEAYGGYGFRDSWTDFYQWHGPPNPEGDRSLLDLASSSVGWTDDGFMKFEVQHTDAGGGVVRSFTEVTAFDPYSFRSYLQPDSVGAPDEVIEMSAIEATYKNPDRPSSSLQPTRIVSRDGAVRLYSLEGGAKLLLNARGELITRLADKVTWQVLDHTGKAYGIQAYDAASLGSSLSHTVYQIRDSAPNSAPIPLPQDWSTSPTILSVTDDGIILLSRSGSVTNQPGITPYQDIYQLDLQTRAFTQVRHDTPSIASISSRNHHMLGNGRQPVLITPDGTNIRLSKLRIQNKPSDPTTTLSKLNPGQITANHIALDGRITATLTDDSDQSTVVQLIPYNDVDHDGIPDDWENSVLDKLSKSHLLDRIPTNSYGSPSLDPDDDLDHDGQSAKMEFDSGTSDSDPDDYNSAPLVGPVVWTHNFIEAWAGKSTPLFREFVPTISSATPNPIVRWYMQKEISGFHGQSTSSPTDVNDSYKVSERVDPDSGKVTYSVTEEPRDQGQQLDFKNGNWYIESKSHHEVTKTRDFYESIDQATLRTLGITGVETYRYETNLSDEFTTTLLMRDLGERFDELQHEKEQEPWNFSGRGISGITSFISRSEEKTQKMKCDYAMEPPSSPAPGNVRIAWFEVSAPNPYRGDIALNDDPRPPVVKLYQEFFTAARLAQFNRPFGSSQPASPKTTVHTLLPDQNQEMKVIPLACELKLYLRLGTLVTKQLADGGTAPILDESASTNGNLGWSISGTLGSRPQANASPQNTDVLWDEFNVPIRLEVVEGAENIRLAARSDAGSGVETFTPVTLPIADLRDYPNGFVLQSTGPGRVVMRASLVTKHGLRILSTTESLMGLLDLDVDSDNSGKIDASLAEDEMEADPAQSGKLFVYAPLSGDTSGSPESWVEMSLKTSSLSATNQIQFNYDDDQMTISKSRPDQNPSADQRLVVRRSYTLTELGIVPGTPKSFYVRPGQQCSGRQLISVDTIAANVSDGTSSDEVAVNFVPVEVVPDWNRDGKIDQADRGKVTVEKPWRWWVNDDDDVDSATGGDIPNSNSPDHANGQVDGMRDLIDFFPIHIDIKQALLVMPKNGYKYFIKHSDGGVKLFEFHSGVPDPAEGDLSCGPNSHITYTTRASEFANYAVTSVTSAGVPLSNAYLNQAENGNGLLLLEATKETSSPIQLEIRKGSQVIATMSFPLKISKVESMYRHIDLTQVPLDYDGGSPDAAASPIGTKTADPRGAYPDTLTNRKYFVFLHGFNVPVHRARGWNAEIFKRMHQMGSKARFVGITWTGATGIPIVGTPTNIGNAEISTDYHKAVFFAMQTGGALAPALAFTQGADITVAAHSLGNMVVGEAIQNGGFTPDRYYIINGAVPTEAYDSGLATDAERWAMTEAQWKSFGSIHQQRLYSSSWHTHFPATDNRNKLTWKNRFERVLRLGLSHNFYSPGDEVVQNPRSDTALGGTVNSLFNGPKSRGAWGNQEIIKGTDLASYVQCRYQGGWGFNFNPQQFPEYQGYVKPTFGGFRMYYPEETPADVPGGITDEQLKTKPFFKPFKEFDLFSPTLGSAKAGELKVQRDVLAAGVPARSYAIATNPVAGLVGNYNMETMKTWSDSWPVENHEDTASVGRWLHSDFRDVAINYLHKMYTRMIEIGELNEP